MLGGWGGFATKLRTNVPPLVQTLTRETRPLVDFLCGCRYIDTASDPNNSFTRKTLRRAGGFVKAIA